VIAKFGWIDSWRDHLPVEFGVVTKIVADESTAVEVLLSREFGAVVGVVPSLLIKSIQN